MFQKSPEGRVNVPPIDGKTRALKVQIKDLTGAVLYEKLLSPRS
jgi:hypothetical protein